MRSVHVYDRVYVLTTYIRSYRNKQWSNSIVLVLNKYEVWPMTRLETRFTEYIEWMKYERKYITADIYSRKGKPLYAMWKRNLSVQAIYILQSTETINHVSDNWMSLNLFDMTRKVCDLCPWTMKSWETNDGSWLLYWRANRLSYKGLEAKDQSNHQVAGFVRSFPKDSQRIDLTWSLKKIFGRANSVDEQWILITRVQLNWNDIMSFKHDAELRMKHMSQMVSKVHISLTTNGMNKNSSRVRWSNTFDCISNVTSFWTIDKPKMLYAFSYDNKMQVNHTLSGPLLVSNTGDAEWTETLFKVTNVDLCIHHKGCHYLMTARL